MYVHGVKLAPSDLVRLTIGLVLVIASGANKETIFIVETDVEIGYVIDLLASQHRVTARSSFTAPGCPAHGEVVCVHTRGCPSLLVSPSQTSQDRKPSPFCHIVTGPCCTGR